MSQELSKKKRVIDTFAARDLKMPGGQGMVDSVGKYSLRKGYGLELCKRRRNRKNQMVI